MLSLVLLSAGYRFGVSSAISSTRSDHLIGCRKNGEATPKICIEVQQTASRHCPRNGILKLGFCRSAANEPLHSKPPKKLAGEAGVLALLLGASSGGP